MARCRVAWLPCAVVSLLRVAGSAGWVMWASLVAAFGCCVVASPPPAVVRALGRFACCACVSAGGRLLVSFLLFRDV